MPNSYEAEIDALRKEVQRLTGENSYLKQRLNNIIKDCEVKNLNMFAETAIDWRSKLGDSTPIVKEDNGYYKLGVCLEAHPVKDIRKWCKDSPFADDCSQLNHLSDDTVVLVIY